MSRPADRGGAARPMTADEAIATRRSVRAFLPDPVPEATVRHILEVAARAPSGTNIQPWHVYVVTGAARERVSREVLAARDRGEGAWHYTYYPKQWREPYLARRRKVGWDLYGLLGIRKGDKDRMWAHFGRNFTFFDAPVGLFFTLDVDMELGSWIDIGMFIENVMIAARGQGLDTCPQAAWVEYHKAVHRALGIPDTQKLVCGMALGHEDKTKPENRLVTEREPVDAFAKFFGF
jgi:nitroreductase